jgi:hypothetical protein
METRLARLVAGCLGVSTSGRGESLRSWNTEPFSGCLGEEVRKLVLEVNDIYHFAFFGGVDG